MWNPANIFHNILFLNVKKKFYLIQIQNCIKLNEKIVGKDLAQEITKTKLK